MFFKKRYLKKLYIRPARDPGGRSAIAIPFVVKGETDILGEWLEHNLDLGIDYFIVYDDASPPETLEIIREKLSTDQYSIIPWTMKVALEASCQSIHPQVLAFAHAILNFRDRFRHLAFIDPDEFIVPKNHLTLDEGLESLDHFPNISLPWHMFGRSGHMQRPKGDVGTNFLQRQRQILTYDGTCQFKCIVDPFTVSMVSVHRFETHEYGDLTINDLGVRAKNSKRLDKGFISSKNLQLNHYYTRSNEELLLKIARGQNEDRKIAADGGHIMKRVMAIEKDTVLDTSLPDFRERRRQAMN
jgi:hypothetical protein